MAPTGVGSSNADAAVGAGPTTCEATATAGIAAGEILEAPASNGLIVGTKRSPCAGTSDASRSKIQLNPLDWAYRGEGSANIVMSYCGHDPSLKGMVLRVCKERPDSHHPEAEVVAGESLYGASAGASEAGSATGSAGGLVRPEPVLRPEERELWGEVVPELAVAPDRIDLLHQFVSRVMAPLIGEEFVEAGTTVRVPRSFLQEVADHIRPKRPPWRQAQGDVDLQIEEALLVTDLTHLHLEDEEWDEDWEETVREYGHGTRGYNGTTFCIELKPKTGFCPSSPCIAPANHVKTTVPRFPMHQQLKLSEGEVAESSAYNPLDLFSSSPPRVLSALRTLIDNPQNNLRIFADGKLLLGGHIHRQVERVNSVDLAAMRREEKAQEAAFEAPQKSVDLAAMRREEKAQEAAGLAAAEAALEGFVRAWKEAPTSNTSAAGSGDGGDSAAAAAADGLPAAESPSSVPHVSHPRVDALLSLATECLVQCGALEKLLAAQKLDKWDIEGTIHAYNEYMKQRKSTPSAPAAAAGPGTAPGAEVPKEIMEDCRKVLRDFLIAATAKDCGIMLALRAAIPGETLEASQKLRSVVCPSSGCKYFYRLSIMDLDIKPLRKMPKYWSMDQQIVRHYCSVTRDVEA